MSPRSRAQAALTFALPLLPAPFCCGARTLSSSPRRLSTSLSTSMATSSSSSSSGSSSSTLRDVLLALRAVVPPLDGSLSKGECGLTGVLGGTDRKELTECTGTPLLVALSSLRFGADQSYVCTASDHVAASMKSYSPDITVITGFKLPYVDSAVLGTLHGGINPYEIVNELILAMGRNELRPLVLDSDAMYTFSWHGGFERTVRKRNCVTVFTPNAREMNEMRRRLRIESSSLFDDTAPNFIVLAKGEVDIVSVAGETVARVGNEGAPRRCAGLGDVLAGVVNTALAWAACERDEFGRLDATNAAKVVAGGAALVREATRRAFVKQGRGMIATDVVSELPGVVRDFEHGTLIEDIVARTVM